MRNATGPPGEGEQRWTARDAADFAFDRLLEEIEPRSSPVGADSGPDPEASTEQFKVRAAIARAVDGFARLFNTILLFLAADVSGVVFDRSTGRRPPEPVVLVGRPGARTGAVVWIHNVSGAFVPELTLRLTDLWHANGSRLTADHGDIEPPILDGSTDRRRTAWVGIAVPPGAVRGTYHGYVLADGLPDAAVRLKLVVR